MPKSVNPTKTMALWLFYPFRRLDIPPIISPYSPEIHTPESPTQKPPFAVLRTRFAFASLTCGPGEVGFWWLGGKTEDPKSFGSNNKTGLNPPQTCFPKTHFANNFAPLDHFSGQDSPSRSGKSTAHTCRNVEVWKLSHPAGKMIINRD